MIGYVTLGVNDIEKSAQFYDELFALCGARRLADIGTFILWGTSMDSAGLAITKPFDGNQASVGNGVMVAIQANSKQEVDAIYRKAIELGAANEGEPGARSDNFYAGYFRDLEGNKLNAYYTDWPSD